MAGCNDNCHCFVSGADGIATDGLGDAESPYVIGVDEGRVIPMVGTHAQRLALTVGDLLEGFRFFETDTQDEFIVTGGIWLPITIVWIQSAQTSTTLSAPANTPQDVATVALTPGYWHLTAKGNIEASVAALPPVVWTARIFDDEGALVLDEVHTSGIFEDAGDPTKSFARPFSLTTMVHISADATVRMQVARDLTTGSQLIINPMLVAIRLPA